MTFAERCATEIETVRSAYASEPLLLPEPGKEVRLSFAEAQKLLREEGPAEFANVRDDEDMSTPQEKALGERSKSTRLNSSHSGESRMPSSA